MVLDHYLDAKRQKHQSYYKGVVASFQQQIIMALDRIQSMPMSLYENIAIVGVHVQSY